VAGGALSRHAGAVARAKPGCFSLKSLQEKRQMSSSMRRYFGLTSVLP
jgi:hypothetical protein